MEEFCAICCQEGSLSSPSRKPTKNEFEVRRQFSQVREVARALVAHYGNSSLGNKKNPFNELLYIILSSKTPLHKYRRAYTDLRKRYPKAESLATASARSIAAIIRFAGLETKKAKQIRSIARLLKKKFGRVTLAPLSKMMDRDAERFLKSLPGIGTKSARCVLMYSLGRKVFPVDNHCYRIVSRLGWVKGAVWTKSVAEAAQAGIPPELRKPMHVGMVLLGRGYCLPKSPRCHACPLLPYCETGGSRVGERLQGLHGTARRLDTKWTLSSRPSGHVG